MKRPYSRNHNSAFGSGYASGVIWIGAGVVIVVLLLLARFLVPGVFFGIASPLWSLGTSLDGSSNTFFASFGSSQKLAAENSALASQNVTLKNENAVLTARAQDLTKLLGGNTGASGGIGSEELLAGVLAHPPESPYDTLTIDAGSVDGVAVDALVFAQSGIPIGTIKHITASTAQVSLYTSPGRSTDGWIGANRTPVTLIGAGAGAFNATLSKDAPISVGDTVYVPGPGALPIGTVIKINSDPSSPTVTLNIQPMVNLFSVTWVEIEKGNS